MIKEINLRELFITPKDKLPDWIFNTNYCIYYIYPINNDLNTTGYIGQAKNLYDRFIGNQTWSHLTSLSNRGWSKRHYIYNALRKHKCRNYNVLILEENLETQENLNNREIYYINEFHTYIDDPEGGGYNLTKGGEHCEAFTKAGLSAVKAKYGQQASPQAIDAMHRRLKELYPETNGASPNSIKAWNEAGRKAGRKRLLELYPETNGITKQAIEAAHNKMKELYPDKNGAPPNFIGAGHRKLVELYPETNGMPTRTIELANLSKMTLSYNSLVETCNKAKEDGIEIFRSGSQYNKYKVYGAPCYQGGKLQTAFRRYRQYGFDVSEIITMFRSDWTN